jgi:hypothetical protein
MPATQAKRFRMLDPVYDRRRPERIGRFNGWQIIRGAPVPIVKFPGMTPRLVALRFLERIREPRITRICRENIHLQSVAKKFGLSIEEYLDAIS